MELLIAILIIFVVCSFFLLRKILEKQDEEIKKEKELLYEFIDKASVKKVTVESKTKIRTKSEIVKENSKKVNALISLNNYTRFYNVTSSFELQKKYENRAIYDRIEPSFLMATDIRNNIDKYAKYINQVRENRAEFEKYQKRVEELLKKEDQINFDALLISSEDYYRYESRILNGLKLTPVVDCQYRVIMLHVLPNGSVGSKKEKIFSFSELVSCYERVCPSFVDREMYEELVAVERGKVDDSLRYNIMNRDNFTCVLCGRTQKDGVKLQIDHIIPISKGGKSTPNNLRTLCEQCNMGKSNKIEGSFLLESEEQNMPTCQWCGGNMILRHGKNGEFYGCSNYPRCKYTKGKYE